MIIVYDIPDMSCDHCVATIRKAVLALDPAAKVDIDLPQHRASIETTVPHDAVAAAIERAGYVNKPV